MKTLIEYFTKKSLTVNLICFGVMVWGILSLFSMTRQMLPSNFSGKQIEVSINWEGANASEIEKYITIPVEEALKNESSVDRITSRSNKGRSQVYLIYKSNFKDVQKSLESVRSKINQLKNELPRDIREILVTTPANDIMTLSEINITNADSKNMTHREWVAALKSAIRSVPGIFNVTDDMPQFRIEVLLDHAALNEKGINIDEVRQQLMQALSSFPIAAVARAEDLVSVSLEAPSEDKIAYLNRLVIRNNRDNQYVLLSDLAKVKLSYPKQQSLRLMNGNPFVELEVIKYLNADTIDTNDRVEQVLNEFNKKFPDSIQAQTSVKVGSFLTQQLNALGNSGLVGLVLVALSLAYFIGVRESIAALVGIPLAYLGTLGVLYTFGFSINLITVIGMFIMVGILVDDAIIVTDRYKQLRSEGMASFHAAVQGARSLVIPITGTMLTTAAAFAPILWAEGELGMIFFSVPIVIISALVISWLECFFVLPNHLHHIAKNSQDRNPIIFRWLKNSYKRSLPLMIRFRYIFVLGIGGILAGAIFLLATHKVPFDGNLNVNFPRIRIVAELRESADMQNTRQELQKVESILQEESRKDYGLFLVQTYGSTWFDQKWHRGHRFARFDILYDVTMPNAVDATKQKVEELNKRFIAIKEANSNLVNLKAQLIQYSGGSDANPNQIKVNIKYPIGITNPDLYHEIENAIKDVPQVESLAEEDSESEELWTFVPNAAQMKRYGISPGMLAAYLRSYIDESYLAQTRYLGESTPIYTSFSKKDEIGYEELENIQVLSPAQIAIPITKLGYWKEGKVAKVIRHENNQKNKSIVVTFKSGALNKPQIEERIDSSLVDLRHRYPQYSFILNENNSEEETLKELIVTSGFVLLTIYLVLALAMQSLTKPILVSAAIPLGFIGVIYALYFHSIPLGVMAFIGLLGVAGVAVNDSLIMIDAIANLRSQGVSKRESIIQGALSRVRALLLTSITTIAGVFPMAYGIGGETGFTRPMAFSLGWGLISAIVLTLLFLPSLVAVMDDLLALGQKVLKFRFRKTESGSGVLSQGSEA